MANLSHLRVRDIGLSSPIVVFMAEMRLVVVSHAPFSGYSCCYLCA